MRSYYLIRRILPVILLMLLAACNLTTEEEDIGATATTPQDVGGKPNVVINSPATGTQITVNREILVSATATDAVGVTRMQLFANGNIVKTVTSETTAGTQTFNAVLNFTPTQTGDLILRVVAYRNTSVSDP
ncbi:MAG TPA: Ig-like domain-containing protein, partial [Phototrophicaceae bacterium]|nr:Ig-like domain-containing protein [Phototrophicaceae bacterium]